jgi:hypothetical protein
MSTRDQRSVWAKQSRHSLYLEGLTLSPEYASDTESYVAGTLTADQLVQKARSRLGLE